MAKRGKKRNPDSIHQHIMRVMFGGAKGAAVQPTSWPQWPEPQRGIYRRMLNDGLMVVKADEHMRLRDSDMKLKEMLAEV